MSDLRDRIAAVVDARIKFWRQTQGCIVDGIDGADVADAVIVELGRYYEDSLESGVFAAVRMLEQHQKSPRHFTQEADDAT